MIKMRKVIFNVKPGAESTINHHYSELIDRREGENVKYYIQRLNISDGQYIYHLH